MTASSGHVQFAGFSRSEAVALAEELDLMSRGARLFATSLAGLPVRVDYTVGSPRAGRWMRDRAGSLSVQLWIDLLSSLNLPPALAMSAEDRAPTASDYRAAFRTGFLHVLGRLLYSPGPDHPDPVDAAVDTTQPRVLKGSVRALLSRHDGRKLARGMWERLEADRCDRLIRRRFPHAGRHMAPRDRAVERGLLSEDPSQRLLAEAQHVLRWGAARSGEITPPAPDGGSGHGRFRSELEPVLAPEGPAGAYELGEFVVYRLLPLLLDMGPPAVDSPVPSAEETMDPRALRHLSPVPDMDLEAVHDPVGSRVLRLPHVDGGETLVRTDTARAEQLPPDELCDLVLARLKNVYGPSAHDAFAAEAATLRRALRINWERRYRGRHRSGKRVGIPNLRRYMLHDDPRLFQRLEIPEALSYYFHLLVDASYSMLQQDNASKALGAASAFTEVLQGLHVPVDVTLYSSALTQLFDHRRDQYRPYFGADFGYLISGTMELEAVAFAKERADMVSASHKLIVVMTDGTPVGTTLPHVGASDLEDYYAGTLVPWLRRAGVDMAALGIGVCPSYHPRAVCLTESWDSVPFFIELLDDMVAEAERGLEELWT